MSQSDIKLRLIVVLRSAKANCIWPKCCLGWVFNFK